jgi:hypothetical protein
MGAITAVLWATLHSGDHVVAARELYGTTYALPRKSDGTADNGLVPNMNTEAGEGTACWKNVKIGLGPYIQFIFTGIGTNPSDAYLSPSWLIRH